MLTMRFFHGRQFILLCFLYSVVTTFIGHDATVDAFGARLQRPWEDSRHYHMTGVPSIIQRRHTCRLSLPESYPIVEKNALLPLVILSASTQNNISGSIIPKSYDNDNLHNKDEYPLDGTLSPPMSHPRNLFDDDEQVTPPPPTVWKDRATLFAMTRPTSIPGIVLFHLLGVFLVLRGTGANHINYWSFLLRQPTLWLTLLSTNLVSATSMVVNDYYDAKLGRDEYKGVSNNSNNNKSSKVLLDGTVSSGTVKRFLMYLYAGALFVSTLLPGVPTRLSVNVALMMTYLYTKHLKPITWVKTIVCACLIALAPWTSGSCAWNLLNPTTTTPVVHTGVGIVQSLQFIWLVPELWRLFAVLFTGVMGREILMDCNDVVADHAAGIRTVPVVFGRTFAIQVVAFSTGLMTLLAVVPHAVQIVQCSIPTTTASIGFWSMAPFRRFLFAIMASGAHLMNIWKVWRCRAEDDAVVKKAVDDSLFTVVGLLASFV